MKHKINDLLLKMQTGENCIGETSNAFLNLYIVSQQREMLILFAKYMEEDKMYARHDEANVDDFLENHSNVHPTHQLKNK